MDIDNTQRYRQFVVAQLREEIRRLQEDLRQQVLQTSYWRDHYEAACEREQALAKESIRLLNHGVQMKEELCQLKNM